jgi:hypothetical protein
MLEAPRQWIGATRLWLSPLVSATGLVMSEAR